VRKLQFHFGFSIVPIVNSQYDQARAYGYSVEPNNTDPLINPVKPMVANMSLAFVPGAWLVDFVPALKYLPGNFPGMAFKETAQQWKKINEMVVNVPYSFVRRQMEKGIHQPSYVSNLVQQCTTAKQSRN
jgi:hypothetical protein